MHAPSPYRPRAARPAASEVVSAALIAAITLALAGAAYSLADFHPSPVPVYTESSYSIYGAPSFLHVEVDSTSPSSPVELRLDGASSLSGILALTANGYAVTGGLCSSGETTFFSVLSGVGEVTVSGSGTTWIDGVEAPSSLVEAGWHEVVIADGSDCTIGLPGGALVRGPSPAVSSIPAESSSPRTFVFFVPYNSGGHAATIVFDGGTVALGF